MIMQVHDELVLEVDKPELEQVKKTCSRIYGTGSAVRCSACC